MRRPPYRPFVYGPPDFAPKLTRLSPKQWLRPDTEAAAWLDEKRALMRARRGEVFAGEGGAAGEEALALITAHLGADPEPGWQSALEAAAALVSDDLCLMRRDGAGEWRLGAASLCAPTFWRLADGMGAPLTGLHGPVPGGDPGLAARIARVFDALRSDQLLERFNWTVQRGGARFTPARPKVGDGLWLRVERQTLRKLPASGDMLFTIRVALDPLEAVLADPALFAPFAAAWRGAPDPVRRYKAWDEIDADVTALLPAL